MKVFPKMKQQSLCSVSKSKDLERAFNEFMEINPR